LFGNYQLTRGSVACIRAGRVAEGKAQVIHWTALLITVELSRLVIATQIRPLLIVKSALAASAPSDPEPLAVKEMAAAG
jgi:hypothetical protein